MWHMIESSLIHGLIYRALWTCMRGLGLHGVLAWAVIGVIGVAIAHVVTRRIFGRRRRHW